MALSDKNIVITPNKGQSSDPRVIFSGADASTGPQNITLQVYPTNNGTLSFEGSAGQLLSVTNNLSGSIFYVNDISGIPSIEVLDTGLIKLAQYSGNVLIGTGTDSGVRLRVAGSGHITQLGVGSSNNASYDFYNNGTSYFNGSVIVDDNLSISPGFTVDAPLFRDSGNTNYYVDPAETSVLNALRLQSNTALYFSTTSPAEFNHDSNSTPVAFTMIKSGSSFTDGDNYGVLNLRRTNHNNGATTAGASLFYELKDSGGTIREYAGITGRKTEAGAAGGQLDFHYYNRTVMANMNSSLFQHTSSVRAPIFYDSNDTGYYTDPASTSILNTVTVSGNLNAWAGTLSVNRINFTDNAGSQQSDPYCMRWISENSTRGNGLSWLEFQLNDDNNEEIRIYGNSCVNFNCGAISDNLYHRFRSDGYAWNAGVHEAGTSSNAPIFNDSNNTSFYVNPADSGTAGNFNGTVNAVIFNTTSDLRLKENLEQITDAGEKVMKLRGMTYNFKNDEKKTRHAGVVAQDVLEVLPEAVAGSEEDQYRVSYGDLVGLLVEAVKELKMEIKQQQLEIAELRKGLSNGTIG